MLSTLRKGLSSRAGRRLLTLTGVVSFGDFVFGAIYIGVMQERGISAGAIGILLFVHGLVSALAEVPSGALGDRVGHRLVTVIGLLLWGASLILFAVGAGEPALCVAMVLWGIGMALFSGAPAALVVNEMKDSAQGDLVDDVVGASQTARWAAAGVGALVVVAGADRASGLIIGIAAGLMITMAGVVQMTWPDAKGRQPVDAPIGVMAAIGTFRSGRLMLLLVAACIQGVAFAALLIGTQPLVMSYGFSLSDLGWVLLLCMVAMTGGTLIAGPFRNHPFATVCLSSAVVGVCIMLASAGPIGGVWLIFAQVALGVGVTTCMVWAHKLFSDEVRNTQASVLSFASGVSGAFTDWGFGLVWSDMGLAGALVTFGILVSLSAAGAFLLGMLLERRAGVELMR